MKKILAFFTLAVLFTACFNDDDLWKSINELDDRVKSLEEKVSTLNTDISSLSTVVNAINKDKTISSVTADNDKYTILFSDGTSIEIAKASSKEIPMIGIKKEGADYYWTLTINAQTTWLKAANEEKIPASGTVPAFGVDAEGYWTIKLADETLRITDAANKPIKADGDKVGSIFSSVTQDENQVTFTLTDGTEISLPKTGGIVFKIEATATINNIPYGETQTFPVTQSGVETVSISKPDGWRVVLQDNELKVTAPDASNTYAEANGEIAIVAIGENRTTISKITVNAVNYNYVMTFENVPEDQLAGPTAYGENLYSAYETPFISYTDPESKLFFTIPDDWGMGREFYYGGVALSRWNDMVTEGFLNQCSAYYADATTGKGGNNGSATFAVAFVATFMGPNAAYICFEDKNDEFLIDHLYVNNATYAALSMLNGDSFAKKMSYEDQDWFKLTFQGLNNSGKKVGEPVDFYLADFRTPDSPGIVTEWTKVDLSSMGAINKLGFWMSSSDTGAYGMNTPAYFCMDDIAVKR